MSIKRIKSVSGPISFLGDQRALIDESREHALKMNFSVEVNMYREKVTSYWYFFNCNQRTKDDIYETRGCSFTTFA